MPNPTVRISQRAHASLKELARRIGIPMQEVLDQAVEDFRRRRFLEEANASYAALREDADAWESLREELAEWEVTLCDGLPSESPEHPRENLPDRTRGKS